MCARERERERERERLISIIYKAHVFVCVFIMSVTVIINPHCALFFYSIFIHSFNILLQYIHVFSYQYNY